MWYHSQLNDPTDQTECGTTVNWMTLLIKLNVVPQSTEWPNWPNWMWHQSTESSKWPNWMWCHSQRNDHTDQPECDTTVNQMIILTKLNVIPQSTKLSYWPNWMWYQSQLYDLKWFKRSSRNRKWRYQKLWFWRYVWKDRHCILAIRKTTAYSVLDYCITHFIR